MTRLWKASAIRQRPGPRGIELRHASEPHLGQVAAVVPEGSAALELLDFLVKPRTPEEIRGRFPDPGIEATLDRLRNCGLIVSAEGQEEAFAAEGHVGSIVRLGEVLAREVRALGPHLFTTAKGDGRELLADLERIRGELEAMLAGLRPRREPYVAAQRAALPPALLEDLRVHLGCGSFELEDWVNVDVHGGQIRMDLRWGLPFADGSARFVFSSHMLEHLYYPDEASAVLRDVFRVLAPGGVLRILVPDLELCLRAYVKRDDAFFAARKRFWPWAARCQTRMDHFLAYAGAGAPPHDFVGHKYGYDFETLQNLLARAGFRKIARSRYQRSRHPELRVDFASLGTQFHSGGQRYCLFVEATKP